MHTVDAKEYVITKSKFKEFKGNGFPNCDPLMIPIITKLNMLGGIATRFCCQGHKVEGGFSDTYIMLVITEDKLRLLMRLYAMLNNTIYLTNPKALFNSKLEAGHHVAFTDFNPNVLDKKLVSTWILGYRCSVNYENNKLYINKLDVVLDNLLAEQSCLT